MGEVTWKPEYTVGVETLDKQHRKLFVLIDRLQVAAEKDNADELVSEILGELIQYAREHFKAEESFMEIAGYPELGTHAELHRKFLITMVNYCDKASLKTGFIADDLRKFLLDWLSEHLLGEDQEYYRYYKARGILPLE